ncbi:MAG: metallophosphoesterase [Candidatus Merdivicinus sp.]|jgi:predicted MPP superfamily phosphohydrolase
MTRETNRRKRLRPLLVFPLLLAGIFAGWIWWGNRSVQRTDFTIPTGLPISEFRIAHISDLHNTEFGKENTALLALLQEAAPALIAVTGDLVDSRHTDLDTAAAFMEAAAEIAPVYYVTGNHEARLESYPALEKRLADAGVTVLRNQMAELEWDGVRFCIAGIDDPDFSHTGGFLDESAAAANAVLEEVLGKTRNAYTILLSHRPELLDVYAAQGVDLVLCGHAHGGQIRLPWIGGLYAPGQGFFPSYTSGLYSSGSTIMTVSRGLGNSLFPFRVNNRPELILLKLCESGFSR